MHFDPTGRHIFNSSIVFMTMIFIIVIVIIVVIVVVIIIIIIIGTFRVDDLNSPYGVNTVFFQVTLDFFSLKNVCLRKRIRERLKKRDAVPECEWLSACKTRFAHQ